MGTTKTFTVAGVSTGSDNIAKVRFANDLAARVKVLTKCGQDDIDLRELPEPMMKPDVLSYLMSVRSTFVAEASMAIEDANDKYNPKITPKTKKAETKKVTVKPGKVKITSTASGDQAKKDKRNARRRELRALKKAEVEGVLVE